MGIPWWAWVAVAIAGAFFLLTSAAAHHRQSLVDEFVLHLRRLRPELDIVRADRGTITRGPWVIVKLPSGSQARISLAKMMSALGKAQPKTADDRKPIIEHWIVSIDELLAAKNIDLSSSMTRVRPRIVSERMVPAGSFHGMPHRALGATPLSVVYVLDSPKTVTYITNDHAEHAHVDEQTLYERARENLRNTVPEELVRKALDNRSIVAVKCGDTYDAARILLLSEHLKEGETLAAIIPDRDTLMISAVPGDTSGLVKLARTVPCEEPRLFDRPIRVSRNGFDVL